MSGAEFRAEVMSSKRHGSARASRNCLTDLNAGCAQEIEPLLRRGRVQRFNLALEETREIVLRFCIQDVLKMEPLLRRGRVTLYLIKKKKKI